MRVLLLVCEKMKSFSLKPARKPAWLVAHFELLQFSSTTILFNSTYIVMHGVHVYRYYLSNSQLDLMHNGENFTKLGKALPTFI